jgi:CubicO group peptidase (beta-lactamase class C family)
MVAWSWPTGRTGSGARYRCSLWGSGGLVATIDDWLAFGQMLLAEGATASGRALLTADSVRLMTTDHTTGAQREIGQLFLEGQGWGFGGSVDIAAIDPWNVPGRYGWVGGTGTSPNPPAPWPSCSSR